MFCFLVTPVLAAAVDAVNGSGDGSTTQALLMVVLGAVAVAAVIIAGLVYWGRKEDHLDEMVHFCLKFLIHSEDETERCASARALGKANDPGALLVLFDITLDEEETEAVRTAASEALHEMATNIRKYKETISDLELAAEQGDYRAIIKGLETNFERGRKTYAQNAYLIARQYIRLDRYENARNWLVKAEFRNRRFSLYGEQIRHWIDLCNIHLLEEADAHYMEGDYQRAKERYAILDTGLNKACRRKYSVYLRMACLFTKMKDFHSVDQVLLQALSHNHDTDLALTLLPLLHEVMGPNTEKLEQVEKLEAIGKRADEIMKELLAIKF